MVPPPPAPVPENKPSMTYTPPKEVFPRPSALKPAPKAKTPPPRRRANSNDSRMKEALARIEKQMSPKAAAPEAAQIQDAPPGGFTIGNERGTYVSPDDPEYVLYQAKIRQRIMNEWILPLKFVEEGLGLICKITVHMNDQGEVVEKEWEQRSGNESFDLSAMRAIERASPLDIPPDRLKYEVFNEGFIVEFKPQAAP